MAHWAAKGVLCECVDNGGWVDIRGRSVPGPEAGERLVIRNVEKMGGQVYLGFKEYAGGEHGFHVVHFRPLTTQDSDVSLFAHLLNQNSIHVSEPEHVS